MRTASRTRIGALIRRAAGVATPQLVCPVICSTKTKAMAIRHKNRSGTTNGDATQTFEELVSQTLSDLQRDVPFGCWTLTRLIGDERAVLHRSGTPTYGRHGHVRLAETICWRLSRDGADWPIADSAHCRVSVPIRRCFDIGSYLGIALFRPGGARLGSLAAMDARVKRPPTGRRQTAALLAAGHRLVDLIEQETLALRLARAVSHPAVTAAGRDQPGWLPDADWRQLLQIEQRNRQALMLPAAVVAIALGRMIGSPLLHAGPIRTREPASAAHSLGELLGQGLIGTVLPCRRAILALLPECDGAAARRLETLARRHFQERGLEARVSIVSAPYEESLRAAAAEAASAVGLPSTQGEA